jgi:nucleotide-binding universal stress UspA family protein
VLAVPPVKASAKPRARRLAVDRVIVPIDLAGEWQSDVIRGAAVAKLFGVPLRIVHVLRPIGRPEWLRPAGDPIGRERIDKANHALERVTRNLGPGLRTDYAVLVGEPAHEVALLADRGSPLIVMSLRGTGGIVGRRGAIAYHVLTHSRRPVLALPRRQLGGRLSTRLRRAVAGVLLARDRVEMAGMDALLSMAARK